MFDFWRNLTKSKAEKQQELLHAYIDNALSPARRQQFEAQLAQDAELRAEVASLRQIKQMVSALPRRPVPRNFTLEPARYGRPAPQPLLQAYPALRLATAMTAVLFVLLLALDWGTPGPSPTSFFAADSAENETIAFHLEEAAPMAPESEMETAVEIEQTIAVEETVADGASLDEAEVGIMAEEEVITEAVPAEVTVTKTVTATPVIAQRMVTPIVTLDARDTAVTDTALANDQIVSLPDAPPPPPSARQWLQLGLGTLLLLLLFLLFLARRRMI
jgi:anti-sigma factor RsiW